MELNRERIIKVLKGVNYPGFNRDIVSFGLVKDILVEDSKVTLSIILPKPDQKLQSTIEEEVRKAIFGIPGVEDLSMKTGSRPQKQITADAGSEKSKLPDVKYYIAVASGKGGVGKSTIATNHSLAISKKRQ
ncbi:MAG: iron-sulfur cluster assembly protein, partial [Candidatus Dadabacteria bacterium]|nr:iron-sulfur cluster assembly protein [Candidatus Dadabacteria bacterium]